MVTNLTESNDVHTTFKQIMLRTLKKREYSIQEVRVLTLPIGI